MKNPSANARQDLIERIRGVAAKLGTTRLTRRDFLAASGLSSSAIERHFDSWSEACKAAGLDPGLSVADLPKEDEYSEIECIAEVTRVAQLLNTASLSSKQCSRWGAISASTLIRRFGRWQNVLQMAGLGRTAVAERLQLLSAEECIRELKRVANLLQQSHLTSREFDANARFSSNRVVRALKSWHNALHAADLVPSPNFKKELPLSELAQDLLRVCGELGRIPSLVQLSRRSRPVADTFSRRHGGYGAFKRKAIDHLLASNVRIVPAIRELLIEELGRLQGVDSADPVVTQVPPHRQGRSLNFRAFAYAPTSEHDVVQLFGAVAEELGFEIVGNRSAFPDCEARRRQTGQREHFVKCLIEYEYASSDYRKHKHPYEGCDLVVCWRHDWRDCPIEVLELDSEIRKLPGWK